MIPPPAPASLLTRAIGTLGIVGLLLITSVYPGATRMWAWPWTLALGAAVTAPALLITLRAFAPTPLRLPCGAWLAFITLAVSTTTLSALASPHRAAALLWSAPLLGG